MNDAESRVINIEITVNDFEHATGRLPHDECEFDAFCQEVEDAIYAEVDFGIILEDIGSWWGDD
jgi:hypothetical protein